MALADMSLGLLQSLCAETYVDTQIERDFFLQSPVNMGFLDFTMFSVEPLAINLYP